MYKCTCDLQCTHAAHISKHTSCTDTHASCIHMHLHASTRIHTYLHASVDISVFTCMHLCISLHAPLHHHKTATRLAITKIGNVWQWSDILHSHGNFKICLSLSLTLENMVLVGLWSLNYKSFENHPFFVKFRAFSDISTITLCRKTMQDFQLRPQFTHSTHPMSLQLKE